MNFIEDLPSLPNIALRTANTTRVNLNNRRGNAPICWMSRDAIHPRRRSRDRQQGMSRPQQLISSLNCTRLGRTIRQVLASEPVQKPIQVHGWVKSVRLQKRVAFAMVHDGTTSKSLQVVFQNPVHAKASVIFHFLHGILIYIFLKRKDCQPVPASA